MVVISAYFSGSETGMMTLNRYRLRHMAKQGNRSAKRVEKLLRKPDRLISLVLIGNNLVNILASALGTIVGMRLYGDAGVAIATGVLTFVVLVFAEVLPKTIAALYPEKVAYPSSFLLAPLQILMMPLVKQTAHLGLANWVGVIILYVVFYMPMNVLLYSGYLVNIPMALEEAAYVDGATTWQTYWKIIFPIMKPMHATVAVLTALGTWNDVMTPLVIMSGSGMTTLPLAQMTFQTQFGTNFNLAFASYLLALLPILIFYLICQKQILNGVVNGAVK